MSISKHVHVYYKNGALIKNPKNRISPIFSPDSTLNGLIGLFYAKKWIFLKKLSTLPNPFAPRDFAEKCVLKLVKRFCGHCRAINNLNLPQSCLQVVHFVAF